MPVQAFITNNAMSSIEKRRFSRGERSSLIHQVPVLVQSPASAYNTPARNTHDSKRREYLRTITQLLGTWSLHLQHPPISFHSDWLNNDRFVAF